MRDILFFDKMVTLRL